MQTKWLIGLVALIAVGVFAVALEQHSSNPSAPAAVSANAGQTQTQTQTDTVGDTPTTTDQAPDGGLGESPEAKTYTMAKVAQHNSAVSCWAAINGNVYDLTNWINQHPGGPQRILNLCGTDATAAFNAQHGGQARPAQELAQFFLAPLAQ
jgi:cytochrome b involved in lipid metabolism